MDSASGIPYLLTCTDPPKDVALPELLHLLKVSSGDMRYEVAGCLADLYPDEAKKAGIYEKFPEWKPSTADTPSTNAPAAPN